MKKPKEVDVKTQDEKLNRLIGFNLHHMRYFSMLSQSDLANKLQLAGLDIDRATLSLIEHGKRKLLASEIPFFAKALDLSINDFVTKLFNKD